ncbi:acetyl-CoA carboxylase biotin carboxyl carrier protein [Actinomadura formosensis]|uniref:acetyl-CoA carboxylase biotin carboxyl carrier protein n=1 Tax=Actinomadura formosensis TaxID=60706 RepID=UPI0009FC633A|nr:biotin/lipoyl-containing protein [Actinomadura formosensis]
METTDPGDLLEVLCGSAAELMAAATGPLRRLSLRIGEVAVELEWPDGPAPAGLPADAPPAESPSAESPSAEGRVDDGLHYIEAEMVGTFYHSPEPGAPPFVSPGDEIREGQQVAILEAMKLMTPVVAGRSGRVAKVLVADGESVEYGTPLIAVEP